MPVATPIQVVVGVLRDERGRVLLAQRPAHLHQGGLWEYPGGKVQDGESLGAALQRELQEELGIDVHAWSPLITIPYVYPERAVRLHVFAVDYFTGTPHGREGQPVQWVSYPQLDALEIPAANRGITLALTLPDHYLVTPEPVGGRDRFLQDLAASLQAGARLVQLRAKSLDADAYAALACEAGPLVHGYPGARILLNSHSDLVVPLQADGVHLTGHQLAALAQRPLPRESLVAASCHGAADIARAARLGADFLVLSPVQRTPSHPHAEPLGWEGFQALAAEAPVPVYALGGMQVTDIAAARQAGGQGIAAMRGLWGEQAP